MWTTEHTATSPLPRPRIWAAVRDLHTGALRYPGADAFELHGDFAVGTELTVIPEGQEPIRSRICDLVEDETYADITDLGDVTLVFRYRLDDVDGGTRVRYSLVIDGPAADTAGGELGPQISADFPASLAALLERA